MTEPNFRPLHLRDRHASGVTSAAKRLRSTVTHPGYATLREKTVGTRGSIQLVLDDGATLRVNVHSLVPCPLVVAMGHGDVSNDGGVFDIVGLPRNQTVRVDVSCVVERMLFTFHHEVPPPLPPEISIDIPRLQPVRIELVNDLHRPLPFVRFLFAVTRADEREAYPYPLWTDYDGGATVLVAGGRAVMEVITVADEPGGTGQAVARRTWDGERTMRFAWGLSVPPPGELHQQDGSF